MPTIPTSRFNIPPILHVILPPAQTVVIQYWSSPPLDQIGLVVHKMSCAIQLATRRPGLVPCQIFDHMNRMQIQAPVLFGVQFGLAYLAPFFSNSNQEAKEDNYIHSFGITEGSNFHNPFRSLLSKNCCALLDGLSSKAFSYSAICAFKAIRLTPLIFGFRPISS